MIFPLSALDDLAERFDGFFVDVFGVIFDGQSALPQAAETLARLTGTGKRVVLFSNSGRRASVNIARLAGHGIPRNSFTALLSSGEVAFDYLRRKSAPGTRVWLSSGGGDVSPIKGLDLTRVTSPDQADLVFLAGCDSASTPLESYVDMLRGAAARGTPCLCSNPDLVVPTPGGLTYGAGRIAQAYAKMGGPVHWIGKPHPLMYEAAHDVLGCPARDRILCIGDSPAHDILGGQRAGFGTALVRTGIHAGLSDAEISDECRRAGAIPDFGLAAFVFQNAAQNRAVPT